MDAGTQMPMRLVYCCPHRPWYHKTSAEELCLIDIKIQNESAELLILSFFNHMSPKTTAKFVENNVASGESIMSLKSSLAPHVAESVSSNAPSKVLHRLLALCISHCSTPGKGDELGNYRYYTKGESGREDMHHI